MQSGSSASEDFQGLDLVEIGSPNLSKKTGLKPGNAEHVLKI